MTFRVKTIRADFPIFAHNPQLVYLDSAATSLKPQIVLDAMNEYYAAYSANVHRGLYDLSTKATQQYEGAREIVREFLHAKSTKEIIFTRGATEALNTVAQGWGRQYLAAGDEIILTILEHHSNIVPWQMIAKAKKCTLKFLDCTDEGILKTDQLNSLITRRTKMIALTHISNALGTVIPLKSIIQKAHASGARVLVDAAQSAPHLPLNVEYLDCDFLVFSGHKMCGPTGIGVLYGKEKILQEMEPFMGGGDMIVEVSKTGACWNELPWKFEAGTPPIAEAIGLGAAINYLKEIGLDALHQHQQKLLQYAVNELSTISGIKLYGPFADGPEGLRQQSGIISFNIEGIHSHDIADILNQDNVAIRAGHHCCMPLMQRLKIPATARASFYLYTTEEDIEKLCHFLKKVVKIFARAKPT